jgi:hypothetical protein
MAAAIVESQKGRRKQSRKAKKNRYDIQEIQERLTAIVVGAGHMDWGRRGGEGPPRAHESNAKSKAESGTP